MSDKPITGDLRRWWELHCRALATPELDEGLDALCGAIDAVHANLERENASLKAELDRVLGEQEGGEAMRLPLDADGVPVHVGDVMEWPDGQTFEVVGIGDGTLFYVEDGLAEWTGASTKFHHHVPDSWERIIEDALDGYHDTDFDALVARCKALAGDAR